MSIKKKYSNFLESHSLFLKINLILTPQGKNFRTHLSLVGIHLHFMYAGIAAEAKSKNNNLYMSLQLNMYLVISSEDILISLYQKIITWLSRIDN